ncbi:MAG: hypothetical protein ACO1O6_11055 [Bacteroidota bacterium]
MEKSSVGIQATLAIYNTSLCDRILDELERTDTFTTVTDNVAATILPVSLALLCLDTYITGDDMVITHIGIIQKNTRVSTGQVRLRVSHIFKFPREIKLQEFVDAASPRLKKSTKNVIGIGYTQIPEKTGLEMMKTLKKLFPSNGADLDKIISKLHEGPIQAASPRSKDAAVEKDAVGLCLDIFGVDRANILKSWDVRDKDNLGNSFLTGLSGYKAYEDDIINRDLRNLPGMSVVKEDITGIVEFRNGYDERLVVINANRKPLEKSLGVDLIYFHREYEAFTFVQYKMMDKGSSNSGNYYNPSESSHGKELERMRKLYSEINDVPKGTSLPDFRLSNCPIYFKLCNKLVLVADDGSIAKGAYISLDQWEILLKDPSTTGPRGGCQIGFHTLNRRYLGTTTFVDLVQRGFVGTQSGSSQKIAPLIEDLIQQGHSVIYAIDESLNRKIQVFNRR